MDRDVVTAKLESLRRCVERVRARTPASVDALSASHDAQDILCLNLERAVHACVDIAAHIVSDSECAVPDTMAGTFDALERQGIVSRALAERMRRAVGFPQHLRSCISDTRLGDRSFDRDDAARRLRPNSVVPLRRCWLHHAVRDDPSVQGRRRRRGPGSPCSNMADSFDSSRAAHRTAAQVSLPKCWFVRVEFNQIRDVWLRPAVVPGQSSGFRESFVGLLRSVECSWGG